MATSLFDSSMSVFVYEPRDTAAQRWTVWIDRFEIYLVAADITKPARQRAMLLHMIGEALYGIFRTLKEPTPQDGETPYDTAKKALVNFFVPQMNLEFEIWKFRESKQETGENLDTFNARLFEDPDKEIKSQLIQR